MKQLVDFTSAVFDALGYLNKFHGLVKTVTVSRDEQLKRYPAKIGFEETPIDFEPKFAYMRLGQVTTTALDEDACSRRVTKSFPFTLVVGLPEDILSTPNEYIALKVAQNISNSLQSTQTNSLRTAIKADDVEVNISDIQTDPYQVWTTERNDHYEYPTDRILISMEVTFVIQGHVACFDILGCDDVETQLVQTFTDSDGIDKEFPFGGHPTCIRAGDCADGSVTNSDATYNATVDSGGILVLPDVTNTDSDGSPVITPAQTPFIATPCPDIGGFTCVQLNAGLSQTQRDFIQKVSPGKTGQTVSYAANDDGDLELGRQVDFLTLTCNTPNGNTDRFTDNGDQTVTDWLWRKMWSKTYISPDQIWTVAITTAEASVLGGHTDWHLPNIMEYMTILNFGSVNMLNYAPFNTIANFLWSSTTVSSATTAAYGAAGNFAITTGAKSGSQFYMICRNI